MDPFDENPLLNSMETSSSNDDNIDGSNNKQKRKENIEEYEEWIHEEEGNEPVKKMREDRVMVDHDSTTASSHVGHGHQTDPRAWWGDTVDNNNNTHEKDDETKQLL